MSSPRVNLTDLTSCGGCASKAGPAWLEAAVAPLQGLFNAERFPDLLVGLSVADDAAVYKVSRTTSLVATVDFFAPLVDDPQTYGAIAAANAMSDVFAMGGEVAFALNVAAFPKDLDPTVVSEVLAGGAQKVAEAGGVIAGGHTIWDEEPKYGLCALGFVETRNLLSKAGLRAGQYLYLTKPIGTGTILSAAKGELPDRSVYDGAVASTLRLNRGSAQRAGKAGLRAGTDVTGFGLLGHLWEMASRSGVAVEVSASAVPLLPGARTLSRAGVPTSGAGRNRDWVGKNVAMDDGVGIDVAALLFDPQTSGGLLLGCSPAKAARLEALFAEDGEPLWRIGRVRAGPPSIRVTNGS
jgi:selenide,water dikinase